MTNQSEELFGAVEAESYHWVDLVLSGAATKADLAALRKWQARSGSHAAALSGAIAMRKAMCSLRLSDVGVALPAPARDKQEISVNRRFLLTGSAAAATAAAAYAVVHPPLGLWSSLSELTAEYRTEKGEQKHIFVGSNVSIAMNTQTSLSRSRGPIPAITLVHGEISVEQRDAAAPFEVLAMGGKVVAEEALFDMRCQAGAVRVTCCQGRVSVRCGASTTELGPQEQVSYQSGQLASVTVVDVDIATAWQRGWLIFRSVTLADAVAEINRYRPGRIMVAGSELSRRRISMLLEIKRLDEAVRLLREATGARETSVGDFVILA